MKTEFSDIKSQLIQAEKMASLGHLIAGIAHEINTPIGAIKATIESVIEKHNDTFALYDQLMDSLSKADRIEVLDFFNRTCFAPSPPYLSTRETRILKKALIKELNALGLSQMSNNMEYIISLNIKSITPDIQKIFSNPKSQLILQLAYRIAIQNKGFETIGTAIEKVTKIIYALKSYSHLEEFEEMIEVDLIENIQIILTLYSNQLKYNIQLHEKFDKIPIIKGFPNDLGQVWTNLIHNALQAMDFDGELKIEVKDNLKYVQVDITDNGNGIPLDLQDKIFEPFFTTKSAGEGTGLGLDIVQKIVNKHGGNVSFVSRPGFTCFSVQIPKMKYIDNEIKQKILNNNAIKLKAEQEKKLMLDKVEKQLEARENITKQMIQKFKSRENLLIKRIEEKDNEIEQLKKRINE